ncbi:MAG: aspartate aminotransferase family protein [Cyanobacteria bacterium]|nr:aspartate aminotransferase family protein [Cyanobacteriota bacterium]
MDAENFKKLGYELIDWIAEYSENGYDGPVFPDIKPGETYHQLPSSPPVYGEPDEHLFSDFQSLILPGLTHWNDPRFFGYFPSNHSYPSILAELLTAGLGVNCMSWATSPSATELEKRMMEWLGQLLDLPWPGVIQDTASTGTLCAVLSAREKALPINQTGFYHQPILTAYTSEQAHSSILKAIRIAGLGENALRLIPTDENYALIPGALEKAIEDDLNMGNTPCFICGTIGTTSSTAIDPIPEIAQIAEKYGIWLHVDAALAGTAAIVPEMKWLMNGVHQADSFLFNPHKWMFTNFDCTAYYCKDPKHLKNALSIQPEYLKSSQDREVDNYRDWGIQLGRRFRALKLWFVMRSFGVEGLRSKIREHLQMTQWFGLQIKNHPLFELVVPPKINTVCFCFKNDAETEGLLNRINRSGKAYLTHTKLNNRYIIRVSFGQIHSSMKHAEDLWQLILEESVVETCPSF